VGLIAVKGRNNLNSWSALLAATEVITDDIAVVDEDQAITQLPGVLNDAPQVVGFSFATADAPRICTLAQQVRRIAPEHTLLVAGGPHPSGDPQSTLATFDAVVVGEGETLLPQIIQDWNGEPSSVTGVYHSNGGGIDIAQYPPLPSARYTFGTRPIEISRGCPHGCLYCQEPRLTGRRMRHRSPEAVAEAIERTLQSAHPLRCVRFVTPDAFAYGGPGAKPEHDQVEDLLLAIRRVAPDLPIYLGSFPSEVRPDTVTEEMMALVTEHCANGNIVLGAQSGSRRMLRQMNRGHTVEDVRRATSIIAKAGLEPLVDFILGLPGATVEDQRQDLELMQDLIDIGARVHLHGFMPLPGTPLGNAQPSPIMPNLIEAINRLEGRGKAFGQWQEQIESRT
jgi:B12-binding domain/radical SAM domain protein